MDGEARSAAELEDGEARSAAELEDGAGVAQGGGEGITAAAAAAATPGTAASPVAVRLARKVAYEYNIGSTLSVLFSYKGTFNLSLPRPRRPVCFFSYPFPSTQLTGIPLRTLCEHPASEFRPQ